MENPVASDKFALIPGPMLPFPHQCLTCGSTSLTCVDFGCDLENNGLRTAVLICVNCFRHAARDLLGYLSVEDQAKFEAQKIADQKKEVEQRDYVREFDSALAVVRDLFASRSFVSRNPGPAEPVLEAVEKPV